MPQELDPYGNRVVVGNITLTTPGLTGTAESYVPRAGGTRGNTRDFRCLWRSGLLPLSCSVSVFESGG